MEKRMFQRQYVLYLIIQMIVCLLSVSTFHDFKGFCPIFLAFLLDMTDFKNLVGLALGRRIRGLTGWVKNFGSAWDVLNHVNI